MTYDEALKAGYKDGSRRYFRGYVSRKVDIGKQPVKTAGGNRKGDLYVELPCFHSSQYAIRQYLSK